MNEELIKYLVEDIFKLLIKVTAFAIVGMTLIAIAVMLFAST